MATDTQLPTLISSKGPIHVFTIRVGTPPFEQFDAELLASLVLSCNIIVSASAGFNAFDVEWMAEEGITFCNSKSAKGLVPAKDPAGLTLGIVGLGAIGKYIARKATVFNLEIKYHNHTRFLVAEEKHFTDKFAAMRDGTFLINTARGAVLDEEALEVARSSEKTARAGLDVLCNERSVDRWFFDRDDVIIQPNLGGLADVAFCKAEMGCFEIIRAFFETGKANSVVNLRQLKR
ncbi:NAD(P)-binding protein [Amniculicola lignicola CBS 123094]|uniref:NAD(P)-binding protein n=1 Tax=Amniculicola lignicola CBS 123094 TaxID=1392246 RepID=A0A6A5WC36_9PLEO|nr:NAD(P)-binding protein [Amniculicola lignicola CBS 123094]